MTQNVKPNAPANNAPPIVDPIDPGNIKNMVLTEQEFEARLSKLSSILEDKINTPIRTAKEMLGKIPFQFVVKNALFIFDETKSLKCLEHGRVLSECPLADRKAKAAFVLDFVDEVLTAYGV